MSSCAALSATHHSFTAAPLCVGDNLHGAHSDDSLWISPTEQLLGLLHHAAAFCQAVHFAQTNNAGARQRQMPRQKSGLHRIRKNVSSEHMQQASSRNTFWPLGSPLAQRAPRIM